MRNVTSIGLILFGLCAIADADLVDNFESYALNTWPSSGWTADGDADGRVVLDPTNPSNQVLRLYGVVGSYWATLAYHPQPFPEEFILEASVYNGSEYLSGVGHNARAEIGMRDGTSWVNPARGLISFGGDGLIHAETRSGTILGAYVTERWYDVAIHYRRNAQDVSLEYYLDGTYLGAVKSAIWHQSIENSFDHIDLSAQAGTAYFDDIKMNVVPLPGAAILGFAGLSFAGWRLRRAAV